MASPGSSSRPLKTCSHREAILPNGLPNSGAEEKKNSFTSKVKPCQIETKIVSLVKPLKTCSHSDLGWDGAKKKWLLPAPPSGPQKYALTGKPFYQMVYQNRFSSTGGTIRRAETIKNGVS